MSLSGINFSGIGSGIDTESIIQQLISLQSRPITTLQKQQQQLTQQQTAVNQISGILSGLQAAAAALDTTTGFSIVKATSSDETVATVTGQSGAIPGSYSLQVTQLAQAHRIGSATLTSQTTALGVSGQIIINGKAINVASTDTLQNIAANINAANVGVNAAIIATDASSFRLTLSSANTGAANTISLSDSGSGTILQSTLGLIGAGASIRNPITNGAASNLFADSSSSIATLLGQTTPSSGTIQINGTNVAIDFATDSLTAIAGKINAAGIAGVTASVVSATDPVTGASRQKLQIVGSSTPTFVDSNNILTNLGVLQNSYAEVLQTAKDATFRLNGINITRSSNTISDVLSGVTINLLKDTGSPSTTINVATDTDTIKSNIETFVNQYNQLVRKVSDLSYFDTQTLVGGPLFGDVTVQSVVNSVTQILTGTIEGLTGSKTLLAQIGITLDTSNILNINDAELSAALSGNLSDVEKIFRAVGIATNSSVTYVSSTEKTKPSGSGGYAINITQLATQATLTAGTEHTANDNPDVETLTFTGAQFGASGRTLLLDPNATLDDIIAKINGDSTISQVVQASKSGNRLVLTARGYGSSFSFTVVSSQAAAANNSGIGNTPVSGTGLDVAGTINGEAATGSGQFLTGNVGNANTEGLQIRVTSTTTGDLGTMIFTKGLASQVKDFSRGATDFVNGTLTLYSNSIGEEVSEIGERIKEIQERLKREETRLREQFTAMERAIARIRAASVSLAGLASASGQQTSTK